MSSTLFRASRFSFQFIFRKRFLSSTSMTSQQWTRIIRFVGEDGKVYQGEPIMNSNGTWPSSLAHLEAKVVVGDIFGSNLEVTDKVLPVMKLLTPVEPSKVPIIRCIGLNYQTHARETKQAIPKYPILFIKPSSSLQDPFEPIKLPYITDGQVDYEAELAVVIKKTCKNVSKEDALDYVLGYTAANDVSSRKWQGKAFGSGQWCFSKGFDTFSPIGPALVSPQIISNPNTLKIRTSINGQVLQDSNTADMIFDIPTLISFLSQGTTLQPGSLILTGTPEGVGFTRNPPIFLQHRDEVSIEIEKIGTLTNTVECEEVVNSKL